MYASWAFTSPGTEPSSADRMKIKGISRMKKICIWGTALGGAWAIAWAANGEEPRVIRPSPAFYRQHGAPAESAPPPPAAMPAPAPAAAAPAPVAVPSSALPPHPGTGGAAPSVSPRSLPPHPGRAVPAPAPAAMRPLPVQPRPGQPVASPARPAAPMTPLPVQPRPVQARPVQAVAPSPTPPPVRMPVPARTVQPLPPPSAPAPIPVQPVPVRSVQPVAPVAPVPSPAVTPVRSAPPPAPAAADPGDHVDFPLYHSDEPVYYREPEPSRLTLAPPPESRTWPEDDRAYRADEDGGYRWPGLALGPKFGTTGIGGEVTVGLTRFLNLRSGFNYGSLNMDLSLGGVKYDTSVDMISVPLLVDLYPAGGNFRLVGGVYIQPGTEADLKATPGSAVQIGSHTYGPEVVGTLTGKIEVDNPLTPYLGIGFGNSVGKDQWLSFSLDLGVILQSYDVSLKSDGAGMTAKLDTFREDMKKEERNIQKDADKLKFYPVVTLGLSLHF